MSAYIVDKTHILYLLAAAQSRVIGRGYGPMRWYWNNESHFIGSPERDACDVGNMLWRENMKSVGYRYEGESSATLPGPNDPSSVIEARDLRHVWNHIDPVQVLKACDCYEYQSCEHKGWEESEAHTFIKFLRKAAWNALPGYDDAKWGAPEPMSGHVISLSALAGKARR